MLGLVSRGLTARTDVGVFDRIGLGRLAASISGLALLVVGYVWSLPKPPDEIERELTEKLTASSLVENDAQLSFVDVDIEASDSAVAGMVPAVAETRDGEVTARVRLQGEDVTAGLDFDRVRFAALCNQTGVDADYEVLEVRPEKNSAVVSVTVDSLRTDRVCYFLTALENIRLVTGGDVQR